MCKITSIFIGARCQLGATLVIKLRESLSHDRDTYQRMMFHGTVETGIGLFLIATSASITRVSYKKQRMN